MIFSSPSAGASARTGGVDANRKDENDDDALGVFCNFFFCDVFFTTSPDVKRK